MSREGDEELWEEASEALAEVCERMTKWEQQATGRGEYLKIQRPNPMDFIEDYVSDAKRRRAAAPPPVEEA